MTRRPFYKLFLTASVLLSACIVSFGQAYGSQTPYSAYGFGDLFSAGTAYNKTMGGVGIASRNNRYINPLNPAAITARDSLAFMADFSVFQDNKYFKQNGRKSVSNTFNIGDLIISFPIYKSSAMMLGIMPYSDTGYGYGFYYDDPRVIGRTGNITYTAAGSGSMYQIFAAAGVTFWKRLSLGAEAIYHFGNIEKDFYESFSNSTYNGANNGFNFVLNGWTGKFGLQYEQPLGTKAVLGFGATYKMKTKVKGNITAFRFSAGTAASDTLQYVESAPDNLYLASELGVGLSFKYADRVMVEVDYSRSDWSGTGIGKVEGMSGNTISDGVKSIFNTTLSESYRVGFEYTPNRNDIRYYFKRVSYRAGAYYKNEYYCMDGNKVNSYGLTLGATLPVFRWYNGLTLGLDFGQRNCAGSSKGIKETYINFSVGFNLFDIWFQKVQYE